MTYTVSGGALNSTQTQTQTRSWSSLHTKVNTLSALLKRYHSGDNNTHRSRILATNHEPRDLLLFTYLLYCSWVQQISSHHIWLLTCAYSKGTLCTDKPAAGCLLSKYTSGTPTGFWEGDYNCNPIFEHSIYINILILSAIVAFVCSILFYVTHITRRNNANSKLASTSAVTEGPLDALSVQILTNDSQMIDKSQLKTPVIGE